jgi:alkylhydroperoxidase family enzyme
MPMLRVHVPETELGPFRTITKMGTPEVARHNDVAVWADLFRQTTLTVREREAFRHRMAHLVGCEWCSGLWSGSLLVTAEDGAIPDGFYENIFDTSWPGYTARERLIVQLIERFATDHEQLRDDDAFWDEMHRHFTETEIVDVCYHMTGPQLGRVLMAKVLLGYKELCEVQPASGRSAHSVDVA